MRDSEIPLGEVKGKSLKSALVSAPPGPSALPTVYRESTFDKNDVPFTMSWREFVDNNFFISGAWDLEYYYTIRGSENFHIYLWIAKDLAWTQDWYWPSMIFGCLAVAWCFVLAYHAIESKAMEEMYMLIGLVLWLSANFVWMTGEVVEEDDDYVLPRVAIMMETAIAWILFLHLVLKPLKILPVTDYDDSIYCRPELHCRFGYFKYWRQYEHAHTLCWLGKDLSWNQLNPYTWVLCLIPTVLIAADFIYVTFRTKRMMEDCVHYLAQLLWVIGNMFWAMGNIFFLGPDDDADDAAYNMFHLDQAGRARLRNWASWCLFIAYWPLIILYAVWIPLTLMNKFEDRASIIHFNNQKAYAVRMSELKASMSARPTDTGKPSFFLSAPSSSNSTSNGSTAPVVNPLAKV